MSDVEKQILVNQVFIMTMLSSIIDEFNSIPQSSRTEAREAMIECSKNTLELIGAAPEQINYLFGGVK